MTYFTPVITLDDDNYEDHSAMIGIIASIIMPADPERVGWMLQSHSETNDFWFGYDPDVAVGAVGSFCIRATDSKRIYSPPAHGVYTGALYGLSDGGGKITLKSWKLT